MNAKKLEFLTPETTIEDRERILKELKEKKQRFALRILFSN
jgi:hypothetical protein